MRHQNAFKLQLQQMRNADSALFYYVHFNYLK